jgi:hypothetical protein
MQHGYLRIYFYFDSYIDLVDFSSLRRLKRLKSHLGLANYERALAMSHSNSEAATMQDKRIAERPTIPA